MPIQDTVNALAAGKTYIYSVTKDPSIVARSAYAGTLALGVGTDPAVAGKMWQKQTTGLGTDWTLVQSVILGPLSFQGTWNATANIPNLQVPNPPVGYFWIVDVAGNTNLGGITDWQVNDWAVSKGGGAWAKIDNSELVVSVNTIAPVAGNVTINASNVPNDSSVVGATVKDALNTLLASSSKSFYVVSTGAQLDAALIALAANGGGTVQMTGPDISYAPAANRNITNITIRGATNGIAMTKLTFTNANYLYGSSFTLQQFGIDPFLANAPFRVLASSAFITLSKMQHRGAPAENMFDFGGFTAYLWCDNVVSCNMNNSAGVVAYLVDLSAITLRTGGTVFADASSTASGTVTSTTLIDVAGKVLNDSMVAGATVKDALNNLVASITTVASTDKFYVDGTLGNDLTADGTIGKPFKTIQACLNFIGQPITKADYMRTIEVYISDALTSGIGSAPQTWNGVYEENLVVPNRSITFFGDGVKIGNNGASVGFGNILKEFSSSRRFGCPSADFRACTTFDGSMNVRDSHNRLRRGMHIEGSCRTTILSRTLSSVTGDGVNKITCVLTPGQFNYPITIPTTFPTEPLIRINVNGTTNYNGVYDITAQLGPTTFEATRVSGVNAFIAPQAGAFFESDSAGASGLTHDAAFIDTYMQGAYSCDDGIVNGAAPTAGTEVFYAVNSRFFTGVEGRTIQLQRLEDSTLAGTWIVNAIAGLFNCSIGAGAWTVNSFVYGTDDMGIMACRFNTAVVMTIVNANQICRIDALSYSSFLATASSWATNPPFIDIFDAKSGLSFTIPFVLASASPLELIKLITGTKIQRCRINVATVFNDPAATLSVGDSGNNSRYMGVNDNVPNELGVYESNNPFQLVANTAINLYKANGAAVTGAGQVILDIG